MDRRRVAKWAAALALSGCIGSNARAGAVTFTGHVGTDMPATVVGSANVVPGQNPDAVSQASWITQSGWTNGWVIKDMAFNYNKASDTMQVGVAFYSIAGDPSGNPSGSDPRVAAAGGYAPTNLGGRDSISVEFAANNTTTPGQAGSPVIIAGVPENKSSSYTGLDGFTVATAGSNPSLENNYGTQVNSAMGNLAFNPSPATPDFEFTVKNWTQFASLAGPKGFWVSAFAGSPDDVVAGESHIPWIHIPGPAPQTVVPEPTTVAAWSLMIAGAGWALRRSRKAVSRS